MDGATPRWADIRAMAEEAERVGFDAVWVSDHVGFGDPDDAWGGAWESWTLLTALAVATTRVQLGTYVSAIPYRNPALLAKMAETLDEVSGGRVILGLGAGWNEPEFTAYGFPWERRFDRFEDGLRIIAAMLRTGRADHDGRVESARGALVRPRGPRPGGLPIMVGAGGAADAPADRGARRRVERRDADARGRRADGCGARRRARRGGARSGHDPSLGGGAGGAARACPSTTETSDTFGSWERPFAGTPAAIAAGLTRYRDLGFDHVQVQLRPNTVASVTAFAPVLEALGAG